jgi:hypothetical protein
MDVRTPEVVGGHGALAAVPFSAHAGKVAWLSTADARSDFFSLSGFKKRSRWIQEHCCIPGPTGDSKLWSLSPYKLFSYTSNDSNRTQRPVHSTAINSIANTMYIEGLYESDWQGQNEDVFVMAASHPQGMCECCSYWSLPDSMVPGVVGCVHSGGAWGR